MNWPLILSAFLIGLAVMFWLIGQSQTAWRWGWRGLSLLLLVFVGGEVVWPRLSPTISNATSAPLIALTSSITPTASFHNSLFVPTLTPAIVPPNEIGPEAVGPIAGTVRLQIPSLNVDVPIIPIPIRGQDWDLTLLNEQAGWLESTGAFPGDQWAMVFVGHMTVTATQYGAFTDLQHVQPGAEVIYTTPEKNYRYRVQELGRIAPYEVRRLFVRDSNTILLLTCTDWNNQARLYDNRLLVRAVRAGEE